jgi:hypothetical protein
MTPDEFNECVRVLESALDGRPGIDTISLGVPADNEGTLPELYVCVNGVDLCLTASPL